jgi:hypothetical protein
MRTPAAAYFLVFLTFWAQLDDVLLTTLPLLQSACLVSADDDEYFSVQREQGAEKGLSRQKSVFEGLKPRSVDVFCVSTKPCALPELPSGGSVALSPLYVFMSLQL